MVYNLVRLASSGMVYESLDENEDGEILIPDPDQLEQEDETE